MLRKKSINHIAGKIPGTAITHSRYIIVLHTYIPDGNAKF